MKQEQVKEHFAQQADEYEKLMVRLVPQFLEQHAIIRELLPEDDKKYRVLDVGCGNGVLSEVVFSKLPGAHIVAFDLTENMLQAYEKKLLKHKGKFELIVGDFRTDAIGDEYDIVVAGLTLHHLTWEEREKFYKTLYGSMKSGGLVICRDIIIDEDEKIRNQQYLFWKNFMRSRGEDPELWYAKHVEKDYPVPLAKHFAWLRKAGFVNAACHWRLYNFAITSAGKS
jgi:tRNA (cmo5U34)-methyltransferase